MECRAMRPARKDEYWAFQMSLICLLLYLNGMAVLTLHPDWFR